MTLSGVPTTSPDPAADAAVETATLLGSTTATVPYSLAPDVRHVDGEDTFPIEDSKFDRSANATLAELLAAAAMANLSADGNQISPIGQTYGAAVKNETRSLLSGPGWHGQVIVEWQPYRGGHLAGRFVVGPAPPPGVDVYTSRLDVSSGLDPIGQEELRAAENGGHEAVSALLAEELVTGLFPPAQVEATVNGPYPEAQLQELRYRQFAATYGVSVADSATAIDVRQTNDALTNALSNAIEADLSATFDSPEAAVNAVRIGTVTITVRTWSP